MKKSFLFLLFTFVSLASSAQLKVELLLNATPPANLSEWVNRREILTALITGQPGLPPLPVKIKSEIKTMDGTVIGSTDLARSPVFTVSSSAPAIYTATEVLPLEFMIFSGKYRSSLEKTGKLPSDNYTLCVQLVKPVDYTPASFPVACKNFFLAAVQLPILMKPYHEEVLEAQKAQTAITFRWTPVIPRTSAAVTYRLQVFQVLQEQSPMQALRSNQPLLDQQVTGVTQYIWRPQMSFIWIQPGDVDGDGTPDPLKTVKTGNNGNSPGMPFIWTIQSLDDHGLPITQTDGNGEARSEPIVFFVKDNSKIKAKEKSNR